MANIFYDDDADLSVLDGRKVAVLGYGSQGHAHALNLQDSGVDVRVGLLEGSKSRAKAEADGLRVLETGAAAKEADLIMMLLPDTAQKKIYDESVKPNLKKGNALFFAHGFNIHFKQIKPSKTVDVAMVAPKGPGHLVRRTFEDEIGTPALLAVHQDATGTATDVAKAYAKGIGATRAGLIETTFKEETETDLFGEQVVLCGGTSALVQAGFQTLVDAGYQPEIAYFECLHELKLIVDLLYEGGFNFMRYSISDTAEYGDYSRGKRIVNERTRKEMQKILKEITSGRFAREWIKENAEGAPNFNASRKEQHDLQIEQVGAKLREMMPWTQRK